MTQLDHTCYSKIKSDLLLITGVVYLDHDFFYGIRFILLRFF